MRTAPGTILLVEDDLGHAHLIRANLEISGVPQDIVHVTDGRLALDFLAGQGKFLCRPPGSVLVLLDLSLPGMDGMQFLRELHQHPAFPRTPVLVFAADDNPRRIQECYELGCSLYFLKPYLIEDFLSTVERLAGLIRSVSIPAAS